MNEKPRGAPEPGSTGAFTLEETTAPRPGDELPVAALEAYLQSKLVLPGTPLVVEQFPHGHSNLTYRIHCGDKRWVLRRPPRGTVGKSAHDMRREFRVLSALSAAYPLAPGAILYCEDETLLGAPFHLIEHRDGVILRQTLPPDVALDSITMKMLCRAFVENLARLHAIDYQAVGLGGMGKPEGYGFRQVDGWRRRYGAAQTDEVADMEDLAAWLASHLPAEAGGCIIHNDYKFDNLLLDPGDLTRMVAVLDWEMATIGDPLMDLGTSLALWMEARDPESLRAVRPGPTSRPGSMTRAQLVDCYAECSGRPVTNPVFYYCYGLFKLAVIFQQSYARFMRGETKDERFTQYAQKVAALARQAVLTLESGRL